jgi:integrase
MPHFPKPFFRKSRRTWYVQIDGKQHNLGPHRQQAFERYYDLMRQPAPKKVPADHVAVVIDAFLEWSQQHRSAATYEWSRCRLQLLVEKYPDLRLGQLKPFHVQQWVDGMSGVSGGTKRNFMRAAQRALRWAEQQGYVDRSPIAHLEKPPAGKREMVVSPEEFDRILASVPAREARDLLVVTWETGCRAQEILRVEARHVDLANCRWVFPPEEEKMKRAPRIVYLTPTALQITQRLLLVHPQGKLFRNCEGAAWTTDAVNCLFQRIQTKLKKKYCLTVLRHSWCTRALANGLDALTVSVLMGHADPSMVARVYSHLSHAPKYLLEQARKATS